MWCPIILPADESAMLCNAILKEPFPPVSLPKREYMENAKKIWEELGLPKLRPQMPWFGYSLGQWDEELDHEAELAVQGRHFETGEKLKAGKGESEVMRYSPRFRVSGSNELTGRFKDVGSRAQLATSCLARPWKTKLETADIRQPLKLFSDR